MFLERKTLVLGMCPDVGKGGLIQSEPTLLSLHCAPASIQFLHPFQLRPNGRARCWSRDYDFDTFAHMGREITMRRAVWPLVILGFAEPALAQQIPSGMTPVISAKYGERVCRYKVNLARLTDHVQQVSGTSAVSILQDPELPKVMERVWKQYDEMGKDKACPAILREYGPRGTVTPGILSR